MSDTTNQQTEGTEAEETAFESVEPPIGWDGKTLKEMKTEGEDLFEETGHYYGTGEYDLKKEDRFEYEKMYSQLRGAMVNARETALNISSSAIVREIGELSFQLYTPEGDAIAVSTGIIVHVHTGSLAIKWMIEEDYEHNRGIEPGDVFCNNDNDLGNVHTADVHTLIPIFHDDELVAWADGVTHEPDIGGNVPGFDVLSSSNRAEDGLYAVCEKIGENDEIYQDWQARSQRAVRTPMMFDLDEKCRLAGCQMVRDAVHEVIDEYGVETFKQFSREAVEEGRELLTDRVQDWMVPGTYRDAAFMPLPFKDEAWQPNAKKDELIHLPVEMEVNNDGTMSIDMEGASEPGPHPFNCTPGAMEGGTWVSLTQNLLHDGKVNDGAHLALETHYPEGSIVNPKDHFHAYSFSWGCIMPAFNAVWKNLSRGFFARGYREETSSGYGESGDIYQGGATNTKTGEYYPVGPFEISCMGFGASSVRDGLDNAYTMWNPESDMGDAEKWESIESGLMYLGRKIKPNTAGHGKYRGGAGWSVVRRVQHSEEAQFYSFGFPGVAYTTSGLSGGYPSARNYTVQGLDTDFSERIEQEEPYPIADAVPGDFEEDIDGDINRNDKGLFFPSPNENDDLFHFQFQGAPGHGDPLERPIEKVKEDVEKEVYTPDVVEEVYGVVGELDEEMREFTIDKEATEQKREEILEARDSESQDFEEFFKSEREKLTSDIEVAEPVNRMYSSIFNISEEWADFFREFWELPEEYTVEMEE